MTTLISIVIPIYKTEDCLDELIERIIKSIIPLTKNYEIILVDDRSPDASWDKISKLCKLNPKIKGLRLSRNFGQHMAITAGLNIQNGKWIVVMDADLQDRPEEISKLYKKACKGFDVVFAQRIKRKDRLFKTLFSKIFYKILSILTETKLDDSIANFGIYHHKVIKAVLAMKDSTKFFPSMVQWVGFKSSNIKVKHGQRKVGKTAYSFKKLCKLALNVILTFSDKLLYLMVYFGLFIAFVSLIAALWYLIKYFRGEIQVVGWASMIISLWLFSGIIIVMIGTIGLYIGKMFDKVKNRPNYIVDQYINNAKKQAL